MRVNTGLWRSQPRILYSLCFGGICIIHTNFEINHARTTLDLDFIMHGHHFKIKINFRFRIAASLVHRGDLESSSVLWSFFPDFYRSKNQENSKTSVCRTKLCLFCWTELFTLRIGLQVSWQGVVGTGEETAGRKVVYPMRCVSYLLQTCKHVLSCTQYFVCEPEAYNAIQNSSWDAKRKRRVQNGAAG